MKKVKINELKKVETEFDKLALLPKNTSKPKKKKMSKLEKNKRNPKSGYWARKADSAWYKIQHSRIRYCIVGDADFTGIEVSEDARRCEGSLEIHHLIEKSQHSKARHLIENGIGVCSKHHRFDVELSAHQGQVKFYELLRINFPDKHEFFLKYKFTNTKDYNYKEAYETLTEMLNED